MTKLESMNDFFTARVEGYDEHMLENVGGCREGYAKMASLVPYGVRDLLDLGCGTGLELDAIFPLHPDVCVTGIDMTQSMLDKLRVKHPDKRLNLICADYFQTDFGKEAFDCAVSFQTMHHFNHEQKTALYTKICQSLRSGGCYIECDYMVSTKNEEDFFFAEYARLRREQNIPDGVFCHYDTPCTVENQIRMLREAGFSPVEQVFRIENTTMLIAKK